MFGVCVAGSTIVSEGFQGGTHGLQGFHRQTISKKGTRGPFLMKKRGFKERFSIKIGTDLKNGPLFKILQHIEMQLEKIYNSINNTYHESGWTMIIYGLDGEKVNIFKKNLFEACCCFLLIVAKGVPATKPPQK